MDPSALHKPLNIAGGHGMCSCTCPCCGSAPADWHRSLKRKLDEIHEGNRHSGEVSARVEIENEAAVMRETLNSQQHSIQHLYEELEEERAASATATSEAMSMILRLQREKAEVQMEFRQFKRLAEEKMSHDQEEIAVLEDLLFKREQTIQSLSCEIQAYKHRMMSYGFGPTLSEPQTPDASSVLSAAAAAAAAFDYPQLRCKIPNNPDSYDAATDLDKYVFGETPKEQIQNIEQRISQMERMPSSSHEKGVVAFSPIRPYHSRRNSAESFGEFPVAVDRRSEKDDISDRVYTVDAVHCGAENYESMPREFEGSDSRKGFSGEGDEGDEADEIKRLYARLQALEADRETMRQTIMCVGTDNAQLMLLKEIAQQLCKEVKPQQQPQRQPQPQPPANQIVKKPSLVRTFSIFTAVKVICWTCSENISCLVLYINRWALLRYYR